MWKHNSKSSRGATSALQDCLCLSVRKQEITWSGGFCRGLIGSVLPEYTTALLWNLKTNLPFLIPPHFKHWAWYTLLSILQEVR